MNEGKTKRYFLYALGEILLVVIGILIAFQINAWKERKKAEEFELKILREVNMGLKANIDQFAWAIAVNKDAIKSCDIILNHLDRNLAYHDSLDVHFSKSLAWFHTTVNNAAYESLKSYGTHIITNDSIRNHLNAIYAVGWIGVLSNRQESYFAQTVAPLLPGMFESYTYDETMKPLDFNALRENKAYKHVVRTMKANRLLEIKYAIEFKDDRVELAKAIDKELANR